MTGPAVTVTPKLKNKTSENRSYLTERKLVKNRSQHVGQFLRDTTTFNNILDKLW